MAGLAELAAVMMDVSQRRLEATAANVSNMNTPGFRARRVFQTLLDGTQALPSARLAVLSRSGTPALHMTGNPLDIAVSPPAVLLLRAGDALFAVETAQLRHDEDGRLVDGSGRVLQSAGGGDLVLSEGSPAILRDGTVLVEGRPEARIGLFVLADGVQVGTDQPLAALPEPSNDGILHQGAVIASDLDLAAEMVELTNAGRSAETGARIFQIYDDLLGKAASSLGGTSR